MLAQIPVAALVVIGLLLALGILFGFLTDFLFGRLKLRPCAECAEDDHHLAELDCRCWPELGVWAQLRRPRPLRLVFLAGVLLAGVSVLLGVIGPEDWNWERIGVLLLLLVGGFVVLTVPDHYLHEHIDHHITRHHLPRILAWTLGTLLVLNLATVFLDLKGLASAHLEWMLVAAALAGLIPDSGPQLAFVFLFADGTVPFSVLLANCVSQSGHGLLPLLSVSRRDSLLVKAVNLVLGLACGFGAWALGF
jgi:hypothetical protein